VLDEMVQSTPFIVIVRAELGYIAPEKSLMISDIIDTLFEFVCEVTTGGSAVNEYEQLSTHTLCSPFTIAIT
jgi:rhamnose utilization protein RhaD (predicted bifunctional aldolase and dehydrogenase)